MAKDLEWLKYKFYLEKVDILYYMYRPTLHVRFLTMESGP